MRLYLVRHAETVENANKVHQGHSHGTLSKVGLQQARHLAERLRRENFDAIYSSDLGRAVETAKAIAKYHSKTPILHAKELRERDMADFCGEPWVEEWDWDNLPETVEQNESMIARARSFLDRLYEKHPEGTVLLVSHGGLLNALLATLDGRPMAEDEFVLLENTSVTIVEFTEDRKHHIHLLNCVKHLE